MKKDTKWLTATPVAHRGLHNNKTLPENSLGAFENAIKHGYGIEFDVWLTNDKELIVHHDPKLNRTCGRNEKATQVDTSKLEEYKLMNTDYSIPTFKQTLELVDGQVGLVIEIKPTKLVEETCSKVWDILKDYKGNYCIESFDPYVVRWWAQNHPEIILGQLCDWYTFHRIMVKTMKQYRFVDFLATSLKNLPSKYYQKICKENPDMLIIGWTVRTQDNFDLAVANVDNIIFETNDKNDTYIAPPSTTNDFCHREY
ncbi:MAG: hypothetical protein K2M75_04920 [Clostridia bacterium]|nr:hypothetical protein [Clostridia bacterium]